MRNLLFYIYHMIVCDSTDYTIHPITTEEKIKLHDPYSSETGYTKYTRDIFQCKRCKRIYNGRWTVKEKYDYGGRKIK